MSIENVSLNNAIKERIAIGDAIIEDIATLQVLVARVASNAHATFRLQGATSGYQVPSAKRFRVVAVNYTNFAGTTMSAAGVATGTTDVGFDSASAPTSPDVTTPDTLGPLAASTTRLVGAFFIFPQNVYPYYYTDKSSTCWLFGYEE